MYILKNKKKINFQNTNVHIIFFQMRTFLFFCLQKIQFSNLLNNSEKKLSIMETLLKLSLAVCFSKKTKIEKKNRLLPQKNFFSFQTDGFDLLYDAHARKKRFTKYFVGWFMGQRSKRLHNFYGVRQYVHKEMVKNIQVIRQKSKEELDKIKKENKKRKENILYGLFEKFQKKSIKKIRFFERKLYLRMRKQWIDYELIKIQRNVIRVRKFYTRTQKNNFVPVLYFLKKTKDEFESKYLHKKLKQKIRNNKKKGIKMNLCKKIFLFNLFVNNKNKINKNFLFIKTEKNA